MVIGFLGVVRDFPSRERWSAWRPTVSLCQHEDLLVDRLELLRQPEHEGQARRLCEDIELVSPETEVRQHALSFESEQRERAKLFAPYQVNGELMSRAAA